MCKSRLGFVEFEVCDDFLNVEPWGDSDIQREGQCGKMMRV